MLRNSRGGAGDETCKFNIRNNYVYNLTIPNNEKHGKEKLHNSHLEEGKK